MKKRIIIVIVVILAVVACFLYSMGIGRTTVNTDDGVKTASIKTKAPVLIVYFSRTGENYGVGKIKVGNTAVMAGYIHDHLKGSTTFEIIPKNPYPESYMKTLSRVAQEQKDNARPAFVGKIDNWDSYGTVFIGYPIWNGDLPPIIYTFMDSYNFKGKTIIPFNTHEGSGQSGTPASIRSYTGATVLDGLAIQGRKISSGRSTVEKWLDGLGL